MSFSSVAEVLTGSEQRVQEVCQHLTDHGMPKKILEDYALILERLAGKNHTCVTAKTFLFECELHFGDFMDSMNRSSQMPHWGEVRFSKIALSA